jgi:colanic acid/amylovoran biosynthesis glycosyltransferase
MMLIIATQEIETESFLINELNEIAHHFDRVVVITTQKSNNITHKFEIIISKRSDFLLPAILHSMKKLFSKEAYQELRDRKKMRVKPGLKSLIYNWITTWMIERRLQGYLEKIWQGEEMILYSYWINVYAYFVANVKKRNPQITAISRAHGFEIRDFNDYIPFRRTIDTYLDKIIFISGYTKIEYESIVKRIANEVRAEQRVIRLGVNNLGQFVPNAFNHNNTLHIASCSGIHQLKRLDLIIDSLAEVSEAVKLNWVHFGDGSDYNMILDYAKKKLAKNNITYSFKGQLANSDILKYYENNDVDIFINASDYEGIPVSIMEAMSYGIPCIARNVGGNSEIVINEVSGKLVPDGASAHLIADVIQEFHFQKVHDFQNYLELRSSTYKYWTENFNAIKNYDTFLNYILNGNRILSNAG